MAKNAEQLKAKTDEEKEAEKLRVQKNIENRKNIKIDKNLRTLMLAISAKRTMSNYGKRHFCRKHGKLLDKKHIDECDILSKGLNHKVTY